MILNIPILRSSAMKVVFINECKFVKLLFKCFAMFSYSKTKTNWLWHKYCKIKLFSSAILHGVSYEPDAYSEPFQSHTKEQFCENS